MPTSGIVALAGGFGPGLRAGDREVLGRRPDQDEASLSHRPSISSGSSPVPTRTHTMHLPRGRTSDR